MSWNTEGVKSNPSDGTLLADTDELDSGFYAFSLLGTATLLSTVKLQHRNAANDTTLNEHIIKFLANDTKQVTFPITVDTNQRVRVLSEGVNLGSVQASLFT